MGKFCQFLIELSAHHISIFSFLDDNLSNSQWILTKLDMCIDIVEIWPGLGLQMGKLCHFLIELSAHHTIMVGYYRFLFLFYFITILFAILFSIFVYMTSLFEILNTFNFREEATSETQGSKG